MLLSWLMATALAQECELVGFRDVVAVEAPAVVVLGERHGMARDLQRAMRVARHLSGKAPVTLALEAVHRDQQRALDDYAARKLTVQDLPDALAWDEKWGFEFAPYRALVTAADDGLRVVGVGLDLGPKPQDAEIPIPPRYIDQLRPALAGHDVPLGMESRFVASMAWRDHELARVAVDAWNGSGFLVVVVGRGHVEGGRGVAWQAARLTDAPVHSFVLAKGKDAPCHAGDKLWR